MKTIGIAAQRWSKVGLLGTNWTMTGTVYPDALRERVLECVVPDGAVREKLDAAIFDELCQGIRRSACTKRRFPILV